MQRDNKGTGFFFGEGQALDLHSILKDIAKQWLALAMLTISAVLLSYAALSAFHPLDYVSTATIAVSNIDEDENLAPDISSKLTSIMEGDELKITHIVKGYPLLVSQVCRGGVDRGAFTAGKAQGISFKIL